MTTNMAQPAKAKSTSKTRRVAPKSAARQSPWLGVVTQVMHRPFVRRGLAAFVVGTFMLAQIPILGAYEAHIINVTARIIPRCEDTVVRGVKFEDLNGNGTQDPGEQGLSGWVIELRRGPITPEFDYDSNNWHDSNDAVILEHVIVDGAACPADKNCDVNNDGSLALASGDTAAYLDWLAARDLGNQMTDGDGKYEFHHLTFGEYIIQEVGVDGWTATTPARQNLEVFSCDTVVNFGNRRETRTFCGDGVRQTPNDAGFNEQCDDGNNTSGDGCSAECTVEDVCTNPLVLNFDTDAAGQPIANGQFIDNEYAAWGIAVTAHNYNAGHPQVAITFDSDTPTGGINGDGIVDIDLGTPNLQFGGPGSSETGDGKEPSNSVALHNLLTIPDNVVDTTPADGFVDDPNDEPAGGSIRFSSATPFRFTSVKYVDLDFSSGAVVGYSDTAGTAQVYSIPVPQLGGNSVQEIFGTSTPPIRQLKLRGRDSYAIDEVKLCPVASCGDGHVDEGEQCDDGNQVNGDGCDATCKPTTWCGDGIVQTPNSFGSPELCDDGAANGTQGSSCSTMCTPKGDQCDAVSPGYFKNNDGCENGTGSSDWADEVNAISDGFSDVFVGITGPQMCSLWASNCTTGTDVDKARCKAKRHLLADEANFAKSTLQANALVAGADDGNTAFDALGLSATSTLQVAMAAVEAVVANPSATKDDLSRAQYVAARLYTWYEKENPTHPACVLPGMGNGVREDGEQCDDGNLIPWDGCSPTGTMEVVLNEIMANPVGDDAAQKPGGEWVELYNLSPQPVSLAGWRLYDASDSNDQAITAEVTDTATTTIAVGGFLVVFRHGERDFILNNGGDTVRLYTSPIAAGGTLIDQYTWTTAKPEGATYARVPDGIGAWVDPCPTPGDDNVDVTCEGVPAELATTTPELIELAETLEPAQVPDPVPDAALFTEEEWDEALPDDKVVFVSDLSAGGSSSSQSSSGGAPAPTPEVTSPVTEDATTTPQTSDTQAADDSSAATDPSALTPTSTEPTTAETTPDTPADGSTPADPATTESEPAAEEPAAEPAVETVEPEPMVEPEPAVVEPVEPAPPVEEVPPAKVEEPVAPSEPVVAETTG